MPMTSTTHSIRSALVRANGTELYCETSGSGPALLFISGATGDAGQFSRVAELLADAFTVTTYDRRGNSRSPRSAGWTTTSTEEQADDAAVLLRALELAPAVVYGNSGGAIIATCLLLRHPEVVRGAIVHEPPLMSVLAQSEAVLSMIQSRVEVGMRQGGHRGAVEAFVRFAAGDANFERLDPALRERMLGNGETLFDIEFGAFESYRPTDAELASVTAPVHVLAGRESAPFFKEAAGWLADQLHMPLEHSPGAHTPQFDHPAAIAALIRPWVRDASAEHAGS